VAAPLEDTRTPPIERLGAMHIDEFRLVEDSSGVVVD
jgi:hypothetical protein